MNSEDLKSINNNFDYLNNNLKSMEDKYGKFDDKFNYLQDEMKQAILDTKREGIMLNARQKILMYQNEYDRKYKYRDSIRRRVTGLLQSADINAVKLSTIENMGEESLLNNPDYWLAPALLTLSYWYSDNRELANRALNLALSRDAEMTSLLFCFIHLRAKRYSTARKWLNKYLGMQTPDKINSRVVVLIEAITTGLFPMEMQEDVINKINEWLNILNGTEYREKEVTRWMNMFVELTKGSSNMKYPYIEKSIIDYQLLIDMNDSFNNQYKVDEYINGMLNKNEDKNKKYISKIDDIINDLIFYHDIEEDEISREIYKNNCIVKCMGDLEEANKKISNNTSMLDKYNTIYEYLTDIIVNNDELISDNSKKISIAFLKNIINEAYKYCFDIDNKVNLQYKFNIEGYEDNIQNGDNEKELIKNSEVYIDNLYKNELDSIKLIDIKNIISIIVLVVGIVLLSKYMVGIGILLLVFIIYNGIDLFKKKKNKDNVINNISNIKLNYKIRILNMIAEYLEISFNIKNKKDKCREFSNKLDMLNPDNYIMRAIDNKERNVIIGGYHE